MTARTAAGFSPREAWVIASVQSASGGILTSLRGHQTQKAVKPGPQPDLGEDGPNSRQAAPETQPRKNG